MARRYVGRAIGARFVALPEVAVPSQARLALETADGTETSTFAVGEDIYVRPVGPASGYIGSWGRTLNLAQSDGSLLQITPDRIRRSADGRILVQRSALASAATSVTVSLGELVSAQATLRGIVTPDPEPDPEPTPDPEPASWDLSNGRVNSRPFVFAPTIQNNRINFGDQA